MLERGNRRVELLSILHVGRRINNCLLSRTDRAGRDVYPSAIKPFHRDRKPLTFLAQTIDRRNSHIIEADLAGRLSIPAHLLLFFSVADTFQVSGYQECSDSTCT